MLNNFFYIYLCHVSPNFTFSLVLKIPQTTQLTILKNMMSQYGERLRFLTCKCNLLTCGAALRISRILMLAVLLAMTEVLAIMTLTLVCLVNWSLDCNYNFENLFHRIYYFVSFGVGKGYHNQCEGSLLVSFSVHLCYMFHLEPFHG